MTPMVVQCSSCLTEFELDPAKVPAAGVRARCSVCSAVITVPAPQVAARDRSAAEHAAPDWPAEHTPAHTPAQSEERAAERDEAKPYAPESPGAPTAVANEPERSSVDATAHAAPSEPAAVEPAYAPPPGAAAPASPTEKSTGATAMESAWSLPKPSVSPAVAPVEADAGARRPINPFLTRDPALRAKRLARALVSDIVAYHPARHAEGLRDGTLKTLFRDEIKKSYEEYVDQVGRDFAGSTTHFQDALNDVLASGKKLF